MVDDGSPDACGSICDDYAQRDKRIRVFHKENGGLSDARNYGIDRASGEYLGYVDSDDWLESDMFTLLVKEAEKHRADIVACGIYKNYPDRTVAVPSIDAKYIELIDSVKALINGRIGTGVWSKLYRKTCFGDIKFPYGHVFEEYATFYKYLLKAGIVVSIAKPLYHYRQGRKDSITETRSMANLVDYWLAHKSRYDYFAQDERFNTDEEIMLQLEQHCVGAIARTWRWCYENTAQERRKYSSHFKEMQEFAVSHFPLFGRKGWPLFLRFSIFMARFDNMFVFAFLYYLNQAYRRVRG